MHRPSPTFGILAIAFAVLVIATSFAVLPELAWWCDLFSHFRPHYAVAALLIAALAASRCRRYLATGAVLLAIVNGVAVGRASLPVGDTVTDPKFAILEHNLWSPRESPKMAFEQALRIGADVIIFTEFRLSWTSLMERTFTAYPYRATTPVWDPGTVPPHATVLLSRYPLRDVKMLAVESALRRPLGLRAIVDVAGRPLTVFAIHMARPTFRLGHEQHRLEGRLIASEVASDPNPGRIIVMGDLNATPWSDNFANLLPASSPLRHADVLPTATWPAQIGPFGIPIDHVLVGRALSAEVNLAGAAGSDHRAMLARFSWRVPPAP